jgi:hypothetical protein
MRKERRIPEPGAPEQWGKVPNIENFSTVPLWLQACVPLKLVYSHGL